MSSRHHRPRSGPSATVTSTTEGSVRYSVMRIESSVTSVSWIPSEAITGMTKMPFEMGMAHYDQAPPDVIEDLEALRVADRFRFANELRAWIDVEDGKIVDHG